MNEKFAYWNTEPQKVFEKLQTGPDGLSQQEAKKRLTKFGKNHLKQQKRSNLLILFLKQFNNPLIFLLLGSAILAFFLEGKTDATIILTIILLSAILGLVQERGASKALEKLLKIVQVKVNVLRDKKEQEIPMDLIVPGDIVVLNAGDIVPADCRLFETNHFFVDEATLTGEPYGAEKETKVIEENTPVGKRINSVYMGTHVVSGSAKAVIIQTGKETEFGIISQRLQQSTPATAFETGIKHFGYLLLIVTVVLVAFIFGVNLVLKRPILESFLFALALGVGFTPQLLPAIITINLSHGAKALAKHKVIVKKLIAIENFGSMNVLCVDKTGSITKGDITLDAAIDAEGNSSPKILFLGGLNANFQAGFANPLDKAILQKEKMDFNGWQKLDEIPYDFNRKKISLLVSNQKEKMIVCKGAFGFVLMSCSKVETHDGKIVDLSQMKEKLEQEYDKRSKEGFRLLGVAYKKWDKDTFAPDDEKDMIFAGFLQFADPLKDGIKETLDGLKKLGISLKIITGDQYLVAQHVASQIGIAKEALILGSDIEKMTDDDLANIVKEKTVYAEIIPSQKERIIIALKKAGFIVGYLGDGINDATALHSADIGISVDNATDVAKEAADFILLGKDLKVLKKGVEEGRRTFANSHKYIYMATSANFGNMFSMAGASLFLPFLPLLPKQILLTNFLTDFPEMTIAFDNIDHDVLHTPPKWNIKFIRNFMIVFGLISSIFDFLTFGVFWYLAYNTEQFRTGWFIESVVSAAFIIFAIRTKKPFFKSRPNIYLTCSILIIIAFTCILPYTPLGKLFNFQHLPAYFFAIIAAIVFFYVLAVEFAKMLFYRHKAHN